MFSASSFSAILLLALASVSAAVATPVEYPEVIPGPGLPSLASLGVTSKDLYESSAPVLESSKRELMARFDRVCNDNGCGRVPRGDAQACVNYLSNLGTTPCTVPGASLGSNILMCTAGRARVYGNNYRGGGSVSSYCRDVAFGGQSVINACTDGNGNVAGADAAGGNGDLIVAIEAC